MRGPTPDPLTNPDATTGRTTLRRSFAAAPMGVAQRRDAEGEPMKKHSLIATARHLLATLRPPRAVAVLKLVYGDTNMSCGTPSSPSCRGVRWPNTTARAKRPST